MPLPRISGTAGLIVGLALFPSLSSAQLITATDQGWYDETGFHDPTNTNVFLGAFGGYPVTRNFFVFQLPSLTGPVTGATLEIYNSAVDPFDPDSKGYFSPDPFETVVLHDVTTPLSSLTAGLGGTVAYQDLGTGTVFGSATLTNADNGKWIPFALNADFLAFLNTAPSQFAVGGILSTLGDPSGYEFVFGSAAEAPLARLTLQTGTVPVAPVPEPATYGLLGALLVTAAALRRRVRSSA